MGKESSILPGGRVDAKMETKNDMGKNRQYIFCLMGKSASGKDTVYHKLRQIFDGEKGPFLKAIVPYTTRPVRNGEQEGDNYYFETDKQYQEAVSKGQIIESREYHTIQGIWYYYTKDDGQIDLTKNSYLMIGTLESFRSFQRYYGQEAVVPFYLELDAGERLTRALEREKKQKIPQYAEFCRRFLADEEDFSEEKLKETGIRIRYDSANSTACAERIAKEICSVMHRECSSLSQ